MMVHSTHQSHTARLFYIKPHWYWDGLMATLKVNLRAALNPEWWLVQCFCVCQPCIRKVEPFWILMKREMMGWQRHQLDRMHLTSADNHASTSSLSFLQAGCSSWHPTNSIKALKATTDSWVAGQMKIEQVKMLICCIVFTWGLWHGCQTWWLFEDISSWYLVVTEVNSACTSLVCRRSEYTDGICAHVWGRVIVLHYVLCVDDCQCAFWFVLLHTCPSGPRACEVHLQARCCTRQPNLALVYIARSELRKVLFFAPSVCVFCLCTKYLGNCWTDLRQIHLEEVFGPSIGRVWRSGSKVKVSRDKNGIFRPFGGLREVCVW